jgi:hypothetical protein
LLKLFVGFLSGALIEDEDANGIRVDGYGSGADLFGCLVPGLLVGLLFGVANCFVV